MPTPPITASAVGFDLSPRVKVTKAIVGSPATNAETIVASLTISENEAVASGIELVAWCAFTVGTSGDGATLKIRQTDTSGATVVTTGQLTVVAANLVTISAHGFDTAGVIPGQTYVATLTVHAGGAASTVSGVYLRALIV